ncbi:MAG TPA: hypothetical protein DEE98_00095 [Elusimicrobia bacterium]|nr:MAG: hypothetical protein A2278_03790 [Elusimicrobia bacterium RIFOXYA12_FULL_49_49]OGS08913.1 MAG: hypothetical protein A2204_00755 [Elusimicrobia bacterium RIFOXYA1_FULL_47_7]OGS15284.1 MAG: hypothetical protein A2251_07105 [Elusimicrobia bacterium RIFOXYA2_FULL_47_53]OGS26562.1 MAG: hypothetical protein A2339_07015 [Elusimicrobia bacterium RIFOXYB12_FULL_50_12]OGS30539.1 MAG: hypothetical protein A2323_02225 [Elusimicrobia bacterium RIFOXYB2_FULL_46_23]HBU68765.1 hypothetical protein [El
MKKLVVNADDFGYREGINKAIVYAHQNGVVTSASLFVEREGSEEAVRLAKENPTLGLGPHIDLDQFFEVDHHIGAIVGWAGQKPDFEKVKGEIRRQMDKYFSFGLAADHIDSHHHAHLHHDIFPVFCEVTKEYKIPVVRFSEKLAFDQAKADEMKKSVRGNGLVIIDHFIEGWYWGNLDESYNFAELMTHPGYGELWREAELANCCQPQLKQYLVDQQIDVLRFSDIVSSK